MRTTLYSLSALAVLVAACFVSSPVPRSRPSKPSGTPVALRMSTQDLPFPSVTLPARVSIEGRECSESKPTPGDSGAAEIGSSSIPQVPPTVEAAPGSDDRVAPPLDGPAGTNGAPTSRIAAELERPHFANRLRIRFRPDADHADRLDLLARLRVQAFLSLDRSTRGLDDTNEFIFQFQEGTDLAAAMRSLVDDRIVSVIEPDYLDAPPTAQIGHDSVWSNQSDSLQEVQTP